jgi:putative SOS response-associated peptidase YedK
MCGRYTLTVTMEELLLHYLIGTPAVPFHLPRYNVAPGQLIPAVIHDGRSCRIGTLRWGLVPSWAKEEKTGAAMINAKAETLEERPAYREPFRRKRCLIPADGFYEWKKTGGAKQPFRIRVKSRELFSFAGLYDIWTAPDGKKLATCTILTTKPNSLMAEIHHRMPVILHPDDEKLWLDRDITEASRLRPLLRPYPADDMYAYPVTPAVGSVRLDSPECIKEWN